MTTSNWLTFFAIEFLLFIGLPTLIWLAARILKLGRFRDSNQ